MNIQMEMKSEGDSSKRVTIVCPACKTGHLSYESEGELHCTSCGAVYPAGNGVLDLLPGSESLQIPIAESMEWGWVVHLYETRLWRRNILLSLLFGISFDREYDLIVNAMNLSGDETILDVACGPGMYARPLAKRVEEGFVVGMDISLPMLGYAAWKAQKEGISHFLFIHGSAKDLPFEKNQFDVINCCGALHLFPELSTMQGILRVLKPGGRFTVATTRQVLPAQLGRVYAYLHHHGFPEYFSQDALESLLRQAGFSAVRFHHAKRYWHIASAVKPE